MKVICKNCGNKKNVSYIYHTIVQILVEVGNWILKTDYCFLESIDNEATCCKHPNYVYLRFIILEIGEQK